MLGDLRSPHTDIPTRRALACIALASPIYGLAMGSFDLSGARVLYPLFSAIKMPLMVLGTSAVCLPGFFVLSTVLGLRDDVRAAIRAILCSQAAFAVMLAACAPLTGFAYTSGVGHRGAILASGAMFGLCTLGAQGVLLQRYAVLIAKSRRHLSMLAYWLVAYMFVGIQMGWMLRPFVGRPGAAPTFFRAEPFSNAYVVVWRLLFGE